MVRLNLKQPLAAQAIQVITVLGCGLRLFHYLRNPSVWHDEAALIVNVLQKSFFDLLGPLRWNEAGPPLFLWAERAAALIFGDSTYALRLFPLVASCAALVLFASAARRVLSMTAACWAVVLFAFSDRLLWHACEAKPYSTDVLVATGVLFAFARMRDWPIGRQLLVWGLLSPAMIFASYPACFLCGALLLYYGPKIVRNENCTTMSLYAGFAIAVLVSFLLLYLGPIRAQRNTAMEECWTLHFPDWSRPWLFPAWTAMSTAEVFRYCFLPFGSVLLPFAILGAISIWRSEQRAWLILFIGPLAFAWLAACVHGYPYGGSRLEIFALPGLAILIAVGAEICVAWLRQRWKPGRAIVYASLLLPAVFAISTIAIPWPRADVAGASSYIQSQSQPDDCIRANHWEYSYYFRHDSRYGEIVATDEPAAASRVWLAVTTPEAANREALLHPWLAKWRVVETRDFTWTTVWLLERQPETIAPINPSASGGQ
ncbi:MAG TPA: glycosyltransferase family 39 protein [Gemmataceae bacterium]|nr:glycosyltransferase family 39 protein [Gemmataceae bacterium]